MTESTPVVQTDLQGLTLLNRGKVRDLYDLDDALLIVTTDRVSAFDVILPTPIPGKGALLTAMSEFWFDLLADIVPNHLITTDVEAMGPAVAPHVDILRGLHHRLRLEGLPGHRRDLRHPRPPRHAAGRALRPGAVHAGHQGRDRAR
jgi:phosphoribosylaminoimidazole-succinocarboxamide synthase